MQNTTKTPKCKICETLETAIHTKIQKLSKSKRCGRNTSTMRCENRCDAKTDRKIFRGSAPNPEQVARCPPATPQPTHRGVGSAKAVDDIKLSSKALIPCEQSKEMKNK
ncbi:hypothetical protein ACOSQ3_008694 [Xanthoceras sorbifolium]